MDTVDRKLYLPLASNNRIVRMDLDGENFEAIITDPQCPFGGPISILLDVINRCDCNRHIANCRYIC